MKRPLILLLALPALLAAGCGGGETDETSEPAATAETITIDETEFALAPSTVRLDRGGVYSFRAVNKGGADHALEIEGNGLEAETDTLAAGESATLTVTLDEGQYELYCPIGNHRDLGMDGSIVVGAAPAGSGTTTGATETEGETTETESEPESESSGRGGDGGSDY